MDSKETKTSTPPPSVRRRFWRVWFPSLAAVGALASLVTGALRTRPTPAAAPPSTPPRPLPPGSGRSLPMIALWADSPTGPLARRYSQTDVLSGSTSTNGFKRRLAGLATGSGDDIYVLGDDEIRVFDRLLRLVRSWRAPDHATCLAVGADGRVLVGSQGRVDVFDATGTRIGGFHTGDKDKPADVTAVKMFGEDVLVADADARIIRRHGPDGTPRGLIGNAGKAVGFMLPNRKLDIAVDAHGVVYATDPGRHQVTTWALDGAPIGKFGKFGMTEPEDFVGCCNPVNLALTPDGKIVTGEKMVARVKVFEPDGTLLALIGPQHFDQSCVQIHLAVDSAGRIVAADPVSRDVRVFDLDQPGRQGARE